MYTRSHSVAGSKRAKVGFPSRAFYYRRPISKRWPRIEVDPETGGMAKTAHVPRFPMTTPLQILVPGPRELSSLRRPRPLCAMPFASVAYLPVSGSSRYYGPDLRKRHIRQSVMGTRAASTTPQGPVVRSVFESGAGAHLRRPCTP